MNYKILREARKKLGYSQAEVARLLGVHINSYRNWEAGAGKPSEENKQKLIDLLDIKEQSN